MRVLSAATKGVRMVEEIRPEATSARSRLVARAELQEQVAELLEQRVAISEVLRAIANSPNELQPIFDAILANATRLCRAKSGGLLLLEEKGFRVVRRRSAPNPFFERFPEGSVCPIPPAGPLTRLVSTRSPVHVADLTADEGYRDREPVVVALVEEVGVRTELLVPMLKDDALIGALAIHRDRVQPFTDKQIDLTADFAAQATIALESIRRERQYREVQTDLAHANRVATIGHLTASIAHELGQPLGA
jgi:GAF domain-containing protein